MMYKINYIDNTGDAQAVTCSDFEDAESIAAFISTLYQGIVYMSDETYIRKYQNGKEIP